jgi:hypothetical protein
VWRGLRPYADFVEVHPPYFVLLTPLARTLGDPVDLLRALRLTAAAGNLVFLTGLAALASRGAHSAGGRVGVWLVVAFVAARPVIVDFLVEFRIDGWGYGLIVWGVAWYVRRRDNGPAPPLVFGAVTAFVSVLLAPKAVILAPLVVLFDQWARVESWRRRVRAGVAYGGGVVLAALGFRLYLLANGIPLDRTVLMLGRYHAVSNAHAGFGFGLLGVIAKRPILTAPIVAGGLAWCVRCARWRRIERPEAGAVLVWLAVQALAVTYPYKQYYAPWFLFGSLLVPSLGPVARFAWKRAGRIVLVAACVLTAQGDSRTARDWQRAALAGAEERLIRWMDQVAAPSDRVVGSPPFHPINRRDTFFLSLNTSDPKGFDSEHIFATLPALAPLVTPTRYRAELEAHPPAVIVLKSPVFDVTRPTVQRTVLEAYAREHGYHVVQARVATVAVRPDRAAYAARNGYVP